jgi:hypothetical protein
MKKGSSTESQGRTSIAFFRLPFIGSEHHYFMCEMCKTAFKLFDQCYEMLVFLNISQEYVHKQQKSSIWDYIWTTTSRGQIIFSRSANN